MSCEILTANDSCKLQPDQAVVVAVVMEELSDKLAVIGKSLVAPMIDLRTADSIQFDQLHRPHLNSTRRSANLCLDYPWLLRQRYSTILPRHIDRINRPEQAHRRKLNQMMKDLEKLQQTAHGKIEVCRVFAQEIIDDTVAQLVQDFTFNALLTAVWASKHTIADQENKILAYWKNKKHIANLKLDIKAVKLDVVAEAKRFKMTLWNLQDTLQEHGIRSQMENNYSIQTCEMLLVKIKKYCSTQENVVHEALVDTKKKLRFENVVHVSMVSIIEKMKSQAEVKLDYWINKYDTDRENLTRSLEFLKADRAQGLERMAWIRGKTANYKPIVKDDRRVKKIETDRLWKEKLHKTRATRIQAWWRGTMVRKALGPYSAKNLAKANKTSKGGKGGKGGKAKKKKK